MREKRGENKDDYGCAYCCGDIDGLVKFRIDGKDIDISSEYSHGLLGDFWTSILGNLEAFLAKGKKTAGNIYNGGCFKLHKNSGMISFSICPDIMAAEFEFVVEEGLFYTQIIKEAESVIAYYTAIADTYFVETLIQSLTHIKKNLKPYKGA